MEVGKIVDYVLIADPGERRGMGVEKSHDDRGRGI